MLSMLTPLFGVAFGAWLLHENIDTPFFVGGSVVIVGMVIVNGREWLDHVRARWA